MKKLFGLLAAAALATTVGAASADDTHGTQQQGAQQQQQGAQQQGGQKGQGAQQKQAAAANRHEVQGRIVDIDKKEGNLKVQTDKGQLEFQFPPASLQGLNQGDEVRLDVVIRKAPKPMAPKGTEEQKKQP